MPPTVGDKGRAQLHRGWPRGIGPEDGSLDSGGHRHNQGREGKHTRTVRKQHADHGYRYTEYQLLQRKREYPLLVAAMLLEPHLQPGLSLAWQSTCSDTDEVAMHLAQGSAAALYRP
jgi:hypothetical protein